MRARAQRSVNLSTPLFLACFWLVFPCTAILSPAVEVAPPEAGRAAIVSEAGASWTDAASRRPSASTPWIVSEAGARKARRWPQRPPIGPLSAPYTPIDTPRNNSHLCRCRNDPGLRLDTADTPANGM